MENNEFIILSELFFTQISHPSVCFRKFDENFEIITTKYKFVACNAFFVQDNTINFIQYASTKDIDHAKDIATDKILKSSNLTFYIDHSDKWMCIDISKCILSYKENGNMSFYELHGIENFTLELNDGIKLEIKIEDIINGIVKFELFDSDNRFGILELIEIGKKITYLMQFSLNNKVRMSKISTKIDSKYTVHIYDSYIPAYKDEFIFGEILIDKLIFESIKFSMEDYFNNWIKKFELFVTPLNIYLNSSTTHRFFDLYRSIESLAEYYLLKGESFNQKMEQYCKLPRQLLGLDTRYDYIYDEITNSKGRIKGVRDYFTHGFRVSKGNMSDKDILNEETYNRLMEYIFILNMLKELGMSDDDIKLVVNRMYPNNMRYRLHTIEI